MNKNREGARLGPVRISRGKVVLKPHSARACLMSHMGVYFMHQGAQHVATVLSGKVIPMTDEQLAAAYHGINYLVDEGVAIVNIEGVMMKALSKYGGTSTTRLIEILAHLERDPEVEAVMIVGDSGGGSAAGTAQLADAIYNLRKKMPVHGHVEDHGFSACIEALSQCGTLTARKQAWVGSIGSMIVVEDLSGMAAKEGVVVHSVTSGPKKALVVPGKPVSEEALAELQRIVDVYAADFVDQVARGRDVEREVVEKWATGEIWTAAEAKDMGLIDEVMNFDEALNLLKESIGRKTSNSSRKVIDTPRGGGATSEHPQGQTMNLEKIKLFLQNDEQGKALLSEIVGEIVNANVEAGKLIDPAKVVDFAADMADEAIVNAKSVKAYIAELNKKSADDVKLTEQVAEIVKMSNGTLKEGDVRAKLVEVAGDVRSERFERMKASAESLAIKNAKADADKTPDQMLRDDFDKAKSQNLFGQIRDEKHEKELFENFRAMRARAS